MERSSCGRAGASARRLIVSKTFVSRHVREPQPMRRDAVNRSRNCSRRQCRSGSVARPIEMRLRELLSCAQPQQPPSLVPRRARKSKRALSASGRDSTRGQLSPSSMRCFLRLQTQRSEPRVLPFVSRRRATRKASSNSRTRPGEKLWWSESTTSAIRVEPSRA